ncbi:hypothetical protein RZN22_15050 [Bacillaceae bacterium S4-13-58]
MTRYILIFFSFLAVAIIGLVWLSPTNESSASFEGDTGYNIEEDIDQSKVIFVYSDPTEHHPMG